MGTQCGDFDDPTDPSLDAPAVLCTSLNCVGFRPVLLASSSDCFFGTHCFAGGIISLYCCRLSGQEMGARFATNGGCNAARLVPQALELGFPKIISF